MSTDVKTGDGFLQNVNEVDENGVEDTKREEEGTGKDVEMDGNAPELMNGFVDHQEVKAVDEVNTNVTDLKPEANGVDGIEVSRSGSDMKDVNGDRLAEIADEEDAVESDLQEEVVEEEMVVEEVDSDEKSKEDMDWEAEHSEQDDKDEDDNAEEMPGVRKRPRHRVPMIIPEEFKRRSTRERAAVDRFSEGGSEYSASEHSSDSDYDVEEGKCVISEYCRCRKATTLQFGNELCQNFTTGEILTAVRF